MYSDSSSEDELEEMLMQLIILRKRRVRKRSLPKRTFKAPRFEVSYITKLRDVVNAIKYSSQFILQEKSPYLFPC